MTATLFRNASVLALDGDRRFIERADVVVRGSSIVAVGPGAGDGLPPDGTTVIDASGQLVMPGLVNAHFHSPVNHLKGSLDSLPLELFMLYESPALDAAEQAPRAAYIRTLLGAIDMLKLGVTSVQDDAFFVPAPTPAAIDAVLSAYEDCGIRATLALDQPNVAEIEKLPFLGDLVPPSLRARLSAPAPLDAEGLLACYRHLFERWHGAADGRLRAAVSCSAPQRVTPDYFAALDALSAQHDTPFYVHILETRLQRVLGEVRLGGRSLVRHVHDLGRLNERLNIIHGVWLTDDDLDLVARSGAVIAHNPISNLRLGSGVMPFRRMRERGIPIGLGTDEAIADDAVNMWAVAKMAGLIHNIADPDYERWPRASEIIDCLIAGGARAMRLPDKIGRVAPGYQADLILLDLDTLAFTPLNDLERQLVYCENGSSVRLTMVAGRIVVRDGVVLSVDEAAIKREARDLAKAHAANRAAVAEAAAEWLPYYRDMYLRAVATDVGMNRWVGDAGSALSNT